jgi:hypothetical protein
MFATTEESRQLPFRENQRHKITMKTREWFCNCYVRGNQVVGAYMRPYLTHGDADKEAFLTRLFDNRKLARIQYHPPHPNEMARPTLWEDNLLVLMIDAFATLLHCNDVPNAAAMPEGIRVQLQDEKLRAASNLPG